MKKWKKAFLKKFQRKMKKSGNLERMTKSGNIYQNPNPSDISVKFQTL